MKKIVGGNLNKKGGAVIDVTLLQDGLELPLELWA
jgi:hypothetical protein